MRPFIKAGRGAASTALAAALLAGLAMTLGGCSEMFERRDTISTTGGNAIMTNRVTHMVDPWPRVSANRDIPFNGNTMEAAFTRYRTGKVTPPNPTGTGSTYQAPQNAGQQSNATPVGPALTPAAASVK